ncbi:sugar ABC transporter permease [Candidatus Bipolaricaulota bacterium]|nr:sugar ABC transporter permease [Candidatus Bipolaricaulota bacterium]
MKYLFKRAKRGFWHIQYSKAPYIFLLPFLIFLVSFYLFPILYSVYLSFTEWSFGGFELIGISNYVQLFHDSMFYRSLWHSSFYVALTLALVLPLSLGIAVLLHSSLAGKIASSSLQKLIYLPSITPVVAIGIIFTLLYEQDSGLLNAILSNLGLPKVAWIASARLAKWSIMGVVFWRWSGYNAVLYIGGLKGIPKTLYEAARVDGANSLQQFWRITIPMLKPVILFTVVMSIIGSYMLFAELYILTGGGPESSTISIVQYIYRQGFTRYRFGYASALTNILFIVIFSLSYTVLNIFNVWEQWR